MRLGKIETATTAADSVGHICKMWGSEVSIKGCKGVSRLCGKVMVMGTVVGLKLVNLACQEYRQLSDELNF